MMKKTTVDSKTKEKNTGFIRDLYGQLLSGKVAGDIF